MTDAYDETSDVFDLLGAEDLYEVSEEISKMSIK